VKPPFVVELFIVGFFVPSPSVVIRPAPPFTRPRLSPDENARRQPRGTNSEGPRTPWAGLLTGLERDGPPRGGFVPVAHVSCMGMESNLDTGSVVRAAIEIGIPTIRPAVWEAGARSRDRKCRYIVIYVAVPNMPPICPPICPYRRHPCLLLCFPKRMKKSRQ